MVWNHAWTAKPTSQIPSLQLNYRVNDPDIDLDLSMWQIGLAATFRTNLSSLSSDAWVPCNMHTCMWGFWDKLNVTVVIHAGSTAL